MLAAASLALCVPVAGAQSAEVDPLSWLTWPAIAAVFALVVLPMLGRRLAIGWTEIVVPAVLMVAAAALLPPLLVRATDGRAAPGETAPWVVLASLAAAIGWFALRYHTRRRLPASPGRTMQRASVDAPQPAPARADAPGRVTRSVFICYRRSDSADVTGRIDDRLVQRFGRERVYKDVDAVPLGIDFRQRLAELVGRCDALIAVIGPQWLSATDEHGRRLDNPRDDVRVELAAALERDIPVVPVLVGGAMMPPEATLPAEISALACRNGIPVRPDPDFHKDLDRLIAGLESHFGD